MRLLRAALGLIVPPIRPLQVRRVRQLVHGLGRPPRHVAEYARGEETTVARARQNPSRLRPAATMAILGFLAVHPAYAGAATLTWPDPDFLSAEDPRGRAQTPRPALPRPPPLCFAVTGGAGCDDLTPGRRCPGMSDNEYRSEFSIWAIAGGQLVVSTDIRNMSDLQRQSTRVVLERGSRCVTLLLCAPHRQSS